MAPESRTKDVANLIDGYLRGEGASVATVDSWIDTTLRHGFWRLRAEWEDLRQEVRTRLLANLKNHAFEGRSSLQTYVQRIARNAGIDAGRRSWRRSEAPDPHLAAHHGDAADAPAQPVIAREFLSRLLAALSDADRRLIRLVFQEGLPYDAVARTLGVSEGTVKSRMFRCRERLLERRRALLATRERREP